MVATKCAARSKRHPTSSTAASTGKEPTSVRPRTYWSTCRRRSQLPRLRRRELRSQQRRRAEHPRRRLSAGYRAARPASGIVTASLWKNYYIDFWEVTACQWQERFDPSYATYTAGLGNYDYHSRLHARCCRRRHRGDHDRQDQEAPHHRRGNDGRAAADRASRRGPTRRR